MRPLSVMLWNPMYLFFCGEVVFLYQCDDLLFEGGVYIFIDIVDPLLLLVYHIRAGLSPCNVDGLMLFIGACLHLCRSAPVSIH